MVKPLKVLKVSRLLVIKMNRNNKFNNCFLLYSNGAHEDQFIYLWRLLGKPKLTLKDNDNGGPDKVITDLKEYLYNIDSISIVDEWPYIINLSEVMK